MTKNSAFSMQAAQVPSLVREPDATCHKEKNPHAATKTWHSQIKKKPKKIKQKKNSFLVTQSNCKMFLKSPLN